MNLPIVFTQKLQTVAVRQTMLRYTDLRNKNNAIWQDLYVFISNLTFPTLKESDFV